MLDEAYLDTVKEYLTSGRLAEDFENSSEERRYEILDFLEKLMDVAEIADEVATQIIFKNSQLGQVLGEKNQK